MLIGQQIYFPISRTNAGAERRFQPRRIFVLASREEAQIAGGRQESGRGANIVMRPRGREAR